MGKDPQYLVRKNNAWCSYRRRADDKGGNVMLVEGIIIGVMCAMYAGAVMDMEDVELEMEKENK